MVIVVAATIVGGGSATIVNGGTATINNGGTTTNNNNGGSAAIVIGVAVVVKVVLQC